jgi:hypothetical protein
MGMTGMTLAVRTTRSRTTEMLLMISMVLAAGPTMVTLMTIAADRMMMALRTRDRMAPLTIRCGRLGSSLASLRQSLARLEVSAS